jgi:hypothetical protein
MTVAERLREVARNGATRRRPARLAAAALREQWKPYMTQLERRASPARRLGRASDAATGVQRLSIESDMTRLSDRILESYQGFVGVVLALERVGIDVSEQRAYLAAGCATRPPASSPASTW